VDIALESVGEHDEVLVSQGFEETTRVSVARVFGARQ
jgi:hypothetical protein